MKATAAGSTKAVGSTRPAGALAGLARHGDTRAN